MELSVFVRHVAGTPMRVGVLRFYESSAEAEHATRQSRRQIKETSRNVFAYGWFRGHDDPRSCLTEA